MNSYALIFIIFYSIGNNYVVKIVILNWYICFKMLLTKFNGNTA